MRALILCGAISLFTACGGEGDDQTTPETPTTEEWPGCDFGPPRAGNDPYRLPCDPGALFCDGTDMHQCVVIEGCPSWPALAPYISPQACEEAIANGTGPRY